MITADVSAEVTPATDVRFTMKPSRHIISRDEDALSIINVTCKCPVCGGSRSVKVQLAGYLAWIHGLLRIQRALPELTLDERELLLTGIDDRCWDRLFESGEGTEQLARIISEAKKGKV